MKKWELGSLLFKHREYNIVGHVRPDGDCIGSQLALHNVLKTNGIKCNIIQNDNPGTILSAFLDDYPTVDVENFNAKLPLICVDCSDFKRAGQKILKQYDRPYLNLDHHISNDNFAQHNIVDANSSSTAELLAKSLIDGNIDFDRATAEALYLGIMTDSNRFAYSTTLDTIKIVEILMGKGISISKIYGRIYERDSLQKYHLLERFFHNISIFGDGSYCTSFVTENDFRETLCEPLDTEGFVNYTRQIDGVKIGAFLEFHDSYLKCSLRSKNPNFRMDLFAKQFGGGGHPAAAGFTVTTNSKNFHENFKSALIEHVKNLPGEKL
ncbi:MAG: DHH family phosphoesterase [Puniceicoccales bacterium]|jgi:phosphoesterase RecJ-like protein|nr:DHH family phosphoesterase [Puniceicoccales bacterium]